MKNRLIVAILLILLFSCSKGSNSSSTTSLNSSNYSGNNGNSGQGGSLARFAISGNNLYVLSQNKLQGNDISNSNSLTKVSEVTLPSSAPETIFPYDSLLFLGSTDGMYIYDISNTSHPVLVTLERHFTACDPVVVDGKYAYVTLHTESRCGGFTNELRIYDITYLADVEFKKSYSLTKPGGLGIKSGKLFVCDNGLKYYDATDIMNLQLKQTFNIVANDVITWNNILIVTANDGIYEYDFSNPSGPLSLLSKIAITPTL